MGDTASVSCSWQQLYGFCVVFVAVCITGAADVVRAVLVVFGGVILGPMGL